MQCKDDNINEFVKGVFKSGAVLVSYGLRGGGKTHCAISFCQRLIENYYPTTPKHVELITNIIFVRRETTEGEKQCSTSFPPHVHLVRNMRQLFPIIEDILKKYGRKDTLIILLLDEAQNFLLGDDNNRGDLASSMKKFCGIIRKFNVCLWLISPAMRNLGPAFRNFLDADNDPGNVNTTFEKNDKRVKRYLITHRLDRDPRTIVYVKNGFLEREQMMYVPTSSWTRDPETIAVGDYVYDTLTSAYFEMGDFPFNDFVNYISGKSSYDMMDAIGEFYKLLEEGVFGDDSSSGIDPKEIETNVKKEIAMNLRRNTDLKVKEIAKVLLVSDKTISNWTAGWNSSAE